MIDIQDELFKDLEAVRKISIVPTMLEVICQTTGMGFAAIARVTTDRWLACSVWDEAGFGLKEGGELKIETTLCNEIRDSHKPIVIDNVDEHLYYKNHHIPNLYKLKSYVSVPIILKDGTFFGTLCAIDSKPAKVNNKKTIATFMMFAELLSFHLQSLNMLEQSYNANIKLQNKNRMLTQVNTQLETFVYTVSHDLKSPISNIEGLLDVLSYEIVEENLDRKKIDQIISWMKSSLKRLGITIKDLATIVEADKNSEVKNLEAIDLFEIVENVKQDLNPLIAKSKAKIEIILEEKLLFNFSKKNFKSIIYNLLSNAIKYHSPERVPEVLIKMNRVDGKINLSIIDNGMGIPSDQQDKVFTLFNRMHEHIEGSGIGLYIVKRIVDNAKGEIRVNSTLNKGTIFTVIF